MKNLLGLCFMFLLGLWNASFAQTSSNPFQSSLIEPQRIIKVGENHYFIDFGKDAFGTLQLIFKSAQTDTLVVHLGEKIKVRAVIDRTPGGTIRYQKVQVTKIPLYSEYILPLLPDKRNTNPPAVALPDSFGVITPFRYCELENLKVPIADVSIKQKVYNFRFSDKSSAFSSSDTVLNQVWDLCKYTIKATSFCGLYVDGDRERIPYEADAFINQLSHYSVDNEYLLARNTNEYFIHHPTWPTEWILHTVLLFYYDFLYTGDLESVSKNYEALKRKTLMDLERGDGLISSGQKLVTDTLMKNIGFRDTKQRIRDIVDWPLAERDGYDMVEINTVVNAFYYYNLKLMSELAGYLGKKEDSAFFYTKSIVVKNAINQKLFNKSKGIYIDGENSEHSSLHANMFPLAFGMVPEEYRKSVVSFVKSRGMACSVYGAQYLLEALYQQGEADYALRLMTATSDRGWWNMIKTGSTMALEAWDMKYKPNADWNHAWGTAPANIIPRYLWGITPVRPGFTMVRIKPQPGNLTFSSIKVPTCKGAIIAEYKVMNDKYKWFTIQLPSDMEGEFILPVIGNSKILVNKKEVIAAGRIITLNSGSSLIEIRQ